MKIRLIHILMFLVCFSQVVKAQSNMNPGSTNPLNTYLNNYVQPPPNAASLGKYADYPVGYFTGVPDISVPIYNLKDGGISLPISLSYHASGIRVSELASWVGLGWALNATGVINRTVRGAPDEGTRKSSAQPYAPLGYYASYGLFGLTQIMPYAGTDDGFTDQNGVLASENIFYNTVTQAVMSGGADCEPDLYTFNVNGHTGKFVFDEKRNVRLLEDEDIKIKVSFSSTSYSFTSWMITTQDGIQYYFGEAGAHELVVPVTNGNMPDANSALPANWYLTRIVNPNTKDTVKFNYVPEVYSYGDLGPESQLYSGSSGTTALTNASNTGNLTSGGRVVSFITTNVIGLRLSSIVSKNYTVQFIANNTRTDLIQGYSPGCYLCANTSGPANTLDSIKIYTNINNTCIKKFALTHSYFTSSSASTAAVLATTGDLTDTYRLKLTSVSEISGDGSVQKPPYSFTYQESTPLPRRLSYDQDHWGFSNNYAGANNPFFTPYLDVSAPLNITYGAARHPKWPDMSGFVLTTIHDPLGSTTAFSYMANSAGNYTDPQLNRADTLIGGLRIQQIIVTDNVTGISKYRNFSYFSPGSSLPGGVVTQIPVYMLPIYNYFFSQAVASTIGSPFPSNEAGGYIGSGYYSGYYQILRQSSGIVPMQDANGNHIVYPFVKETFGAHGEGGYKNYTFNALYGNPESPQVNSMLDFSTYTTTSLMPVTLVGGGVSSVNEIVGNGHMNDTVAYPLILPANVSYSTNYNQIVNTYPFTPKQVDLISGKLLEEDTFDALGNVITTVTNNYATNFQENFWIRGMEAYLPMATFAFPYNALAFYKLHTGVSHLVSTTKKTYNGSNAVTVITKYGYESPYHTLSTSDTTTDSQGSVLINKTYYSFDYANTATTDNVFGKMKLRNLLEPVRTQNWKNGNLVGEKITKFYDFASSSADTLINPLNVYALETATPLTPALANETIAWGAPQTTLLPANSDLISKVNFTFDGTTGKLISQQLTSDKSQGVQWSNQLKVPVALVDNAMNTATLKEFYYEGFEESTVSQLYTGNGHTGTKSVFAPYTVTWTLPNSRSYVISYWYLYNGVWTFMPEQAFTGTLALSSLGTAYDDIRIHPVDANMVTYTYDPTGSLTSSTDAKSLTTYYEYDSFQRLRNIRDYQKNITKSICYNYNGQGDGCFINMPTYTNAVTSGLYTRSCTAGYTGTTVTYTVPAGTYTSNISQQDANNQAQNDLNLNGLNYANINGACVINVTFTLSNTTNSGYQINFSNSSASLTYNFLNSGTTTIPVPSGLYNISAYPTGAYVNHTITLTGQTPVTAPRASYSGINVITGSNLTLSIQ